MVKLSDLPNEINILISEKIESGTVMEARDLLRRQSEMRSQENLPPIEGGGQAIPLLPDIPKKLLLAVPKEIRQLLSKPSLTKSEASSLFSEGFINEEKFLESIEDFSEEDKKILLDEAREERDKKRISAMEEIEKSRAAADRPAMEAAQAELQRFQNIEQGIGLTGEEAMSREQLLIEKQKGVPFAPQAEQFAGGILEARKQRQQKEKAELPRPVKPLRALTPEEEEEERRKRKMLGVVRK